MAFLDDLLTFSGSVHGGKKLDYGVFDQRPWFDKLRDKPIEPEYRMHMTVAGFPLVLLHKKDGQLYTPAKGIMLMQSWQDKNIVLPHDFYLGDILGYKTDDGNLLLSSRIQKGYDDFRPRAPFVLNQGITVAHAVTPEGEVVEARLHYSFNAGRDMIFTVYREKETKAIVAEAELNISVPCLFDRQGMGHMRQRDMDMPIYFSVDYEPTLRNLAALVQKEKFTEEDLLSLYNLQYFVTQKLMVSVGSPEKKHLN